MLINGLLQTAHDFSKDIGNKHLKYQPKSHCDRLAHLSSLRMAMLLVHRGSLVLLAPTMSSMKVGQCKGHSCFTICSRNITSTVSGCGWAGVVCLNIPIRGLCLVLRGRLYWSVQEKKKRQLSIMCVFRLDADQEPLTSSDSREEDSLMVRPTMYFLMPAMEIDKFVTFVQYFTASKPHTFALLSGESLPSCLDKDLQHLQGKVLGV